MRIGGVDIPPAVLRAHEEGRLVIFAGAGISMDPPSNYPDFENLVKQVVQGTTFTLGPSDRLDIFLGRAAHKGVKVHEQVKDLLSNPDSSPNHFHNSIVRLQKDEKDFRMITTNFDEHFTSAARDAGLSVEVYRAPALPIGRDFQGIVYLHGCVDGPADRLVLTDSDFGRAYMTDGWASRFLVDVYKNFTVLFIGYSYGDLVLSYLTRGLSPDVARLYALTPEDEPADKWSFLGIEPIPYTLQTGEDKHIALGDAIKQWADNTSMGNLDHETRIRQSLSARPPLPETEDDDYFQDALRDPVKVRFFVQHAHGTEWLLWAEDRNLLSPLFSIEAESSETIPYLAEWFASEFVVKEPEIALRIFERQGQLMSRSLWSAITFSFFRHEDIHEDSLSKWVPLLIQQYPPGEEVLGLEHVFDKCTVAVDWSLALLLFQFLTRPIIRIKKPFGLSGLEAEKTSSEVQILGSYHSLHDAWEKCFKPNIAVVSRDISRISAHQIRTALELGRCHHIAKNELDSLSYRRSAIEPHEQDGYPNDFDVVIDSCRDTLEWLLQNDHTYARMLIDEWIESTPPLLRRLAIHGVSEDPRMSVDDKQRWVLEHELMGSLTIPHELYRLLGNTYPETGSELRIALIEQARHFTELKISANPDRDPDMYVHSLFRLLVCLDNAAEGSCPLVQEQLEKIRKEHPKWEVSKHPDFTSWTSSFSGSESPISAEELRETDVEKAIPYFLTYREDNIIGPSREGLLEQLAAAAKEDPSWGLRIMRELPISGEGTGDVWERLLWAYSDASLTDEQWEELLTLIDSNDELLEHDYSLARILAQGVRKSENSLPYLLLPLAERIASKLWEVAARRDKTSEDHSEDWLEEAINDTGGVLAEFFLNDISMRKKREEPSSDGIPIALHKLMDDIIEGDNITATMGRVLLASQLHYLFSIDPNWTTKNLIPLFDWNHNELQAVQAWHGFLFWGRWFDDLLHHLLPLYEECFGRLDTNLKEVSDRFIDHVAAICVFSSLKERTRGDWLNRYLTIVDNLSRKRFASSIGRCLRDIGDERAKTIWEEWLSRYWENRLLGKPVPLDKEEIAEMVQWSPELEPVFPSVVEVICESEQKLPIDDIIIHRLLEKNIPTEFPTATSRLLVYIVSSTLRQIFWGLDQIIEILLKYPEAHSDLKKTLNALAEKGFPKAAEYKTRLDEMNQES